VKGKTPTDIGIPSCTKMLCNLLDQENDNGAALLSLVDRYIHHFGRRYCNLSFDEQQDIQQEVAINLLHHGESVRQNCSRAWVYTIVRNQCINHIRKRTCRSSIIKSTENYDAIASIVGKAPSLDHGLNVDVIDSIDCLQKVFDQIEAQETGKEDIAIYTQYAFGLSYLEISASSNRTVAAIGNRISILKKRLKKLIEEYC